MVGDQDDLGAKIEAQGDIVRKLKAEKADKAKVTSGPIWQIISGVNATLTFLFRLMVQLSSCWL